MLEPCLIATTEVLGDLSRAPASWGWLDLKVSRSESLAAIEAYVHGRYASRVKMGGRTRDLPEGHRLRQAETIDGAAVWYRARKDVPLEAWHQFLQRRPGAGLSVDEFRDFIPQGWREPSVDGLFYALVEDRSIDPTQWTAWNLAGGIAVPSSLIVFDQSRDPTSVFKGHWPQSETRDTKAIVVGVGSIGSAAALSLGDYEVRTVVLIDPDRLLPHNVARHRCGLEDIGRFKVDAVADLIRHRRPQSEVTSLRFDVISDADLVRPVLDDADVVICGVDGVAARQTVSHLCSMANVPVVFACVLDDGALGEIVRVPARDDVGCLRCLRLELEGAGLMDPEPTLDLEYGTGTTHRPMTAIAGDLALMGSLAAKAAVATILERRGYRDQRLASDHLVVGLRPEREFDPPFDQSRVLELTTTPIPPPDPDCPLCSGDQTYDSA